MKKTLIKTLSLLIILLLLVSCRQKNSEELVNTTNNNESTNSISPTENIDYKEDEYEVFEPKYYSYSDSLNYTNSLGSTHIYNVEEGDIDLVKDGKTSFYIVYPKNPTSRITKSVQFLIQYFEKATGIYLQSMTDETFDNYYRDQNFISIGDTTVFTRSNIEMDKNELGTSGFIIKTNDNGVFLNGGIYSYAYAVQEFLYREFNYIYYQYDEILINTNVENVKLYDGIRGSLGEALL